jgi:TM2 domain-containing membrane protein YozV
MARIIEIMPELTGEEMFYIQNLLKDMSDETARTFASVYRARRREPQLILVLTLLGLIGFAGIHRMILNQIGMGILYFFTAGLCFVGTIVDLVNNQKLSFEYNRKIADEVIAMVRQ